MSHPVVHYVGYWNNSQDQYPQYEKPEANTASDSEIKIVMDLLDKIKQSDKTRLLYCRGSSPCRICGNTNGSQEYQVAIRNKRKDVICYINIPEGLKHYVADHRVKLSVEQFDLLNKAAQAV